MSHDATHLWTTARAALRARLDEAHYDLWIEPLEAAGVEGDTLRLIAPEALRGWIEDRLRPAIEEAVVQAGLPGARVELVGDEERPRSEEAPRRAAPARGGRGDHPAPVPGDPALNPKYTFEQFVIGDANRFAHGAALAAAELPAQAYNPLFLYGPPGVGKSHLLHAIGNYVRAHDPSATVRYTTAEHFTNAFLDALHGGDVAAFKARFRHVDVLLIDDIQFLERKARTEEEFFHTFNALRDGGAQVVLTSDRLPRDLDALELRLRERFDAGLVTDIGPPDPAMRMAVLRKRAALDGVRVPDAALQRIADRVDANVRALEAALIRTVAFASLTGSDLDESIAARVLDDLYPAPRGRRPGVLRTDDVIVLVAESFALEPDELRTSSRATRVAWPRQLAMYLAREHTDESLPAIARAFGAKAHTTVLHACRRTDARVREDPEAQALASDLARRLHGVGS